MSIANQTRQAWLAERQTAIGASEMPSVFGVGFETPYQLWARKSGLVPRLDDDTERMEIGTLLQDDIAELLRRRTELHIVEAPQDEFIRCADHPFIGCTPDARAFDEKRPGPGTCEIKDVEHWMQADWADGPPLRVQVQVQTQMLCLGYDWGVAAGFIGKSTLKWYIAERDEAFIRTLVKVATDFWRRIQDGDPPPVDGSDATRRVLAAMHPNDNGEIVALPSEFSEYAASLASLKAQASRLDDEITRLENAVRAAMGPNTLALLPDGSGWSWKTQDRKAYQVPASTTRVLRRTRAVKTNGKGTVDAQETADTRYLFAESSLFRIGGELKYQSPSGSRYFELPGGLQVRVSDHQPNYATARWMGRDQVASVRVDGDDWRSQIETITGPLS